MQCDAELDVQVQLAWAVRRELDLLLSRFLDSEDQFSASGDLQEVASVGGADGFSYLLGKLLSSCATDQGRPEAALPSLHEALGSTLRHCIATPILKVAVTEGLCQAPSTFGSLQDLATCSSLTVEEQVSLALSACSSASSSLKWQGQQFLASLLKSICDSEASLPPTLIHEVYTVVRSQNIQVPVSGPQLRAVLAKAQEAEKTVDSVLIPFSDASSSFSALAAAQQLSCVTTGSEHQGAQQQLREPQALASFRAIVKLPATKLDAEEILARLARLDMATLAETLREAGPQCTHDADLLNSVLFGFTDPSDVELAHVVALLASSSDVAAARAAAEGDDFLRWDTTTLAETLRGKYIGTTWQDVMAACDVESFLVPDQEGWKAIKDFWTAVGDAMSFPIVPFVSHPWRNLKGQLSLLLFAITEPKSVVDFTTDSAQERLDPQPVCTDKKVANALSNGAWTCLEFLAVLIHASEHSEEMLQMVLRMLEAPMQAAPDILLLGFGMLASIDASTIRCKLPSHVISNLAHKVVNSQSPSSRQVMSKLNAKAFPGFAYAVQSAYQADPTSITTIFSIVQELGALSAVLQAAREADNGLFAIELAVAASRADSLSLSSWLPTLFAEDSTTAVTTVASFLTRKLESQTGHRTSQALDRTSLEQLAAVLTQIVPSLATSEKLHLHPVLSSAVQADPNSPLHPLLSLVQVQWPPGTDEKTNQLFTQLYEKGEAGVNELVQQMREMAAGSDIETAEYMIQDIFEEYPFFGQYPSDKLRTTAALIGSMIAQAVFVGRSLFLALKMIIECLESPQAQTASEAAHLRAFALNALRAMIPAFKEHPQFCERVMQQTESLRNEPDLLDALATALKAHGIPLPAAAVAVATAAGTSASVNASPVTPAVAAAAPSMGAPSASIAAEQALQALPAASAVPGAAPDKGPPPGLQRRRTEPPPDGAPNTPVDTNNADQEAGTQYAELFLQAKERKAAAKALWKHGGHGADAPETKISDRVLFLINNFTMEKTQTTGDEIRSILTKSYFMWFAYHLVRDRAANEGQYHDAYIQMLLYIDSPLLLRCVSDVSSEGVLFMAALCVEGTNIKENHNMRNMLKALGEFIGKLTLRRNVPILRRDLDLRRLLVDGYIFGRLVAVVPVVTAIMTHAKDSPVFSSLSNPWVKHIFGLLKEIYSLENLKLTLMFSFETLCKHYGIKMEAVEATKLLAGRERIVMHGADFKALNHELAQQQAGVAEAAAADRVAHAMKPEQAQLGGQPTSMAGQAAPVPPPPPPAAGLQSIVKIPMELQQYSEQLTPLIAGCLERAVTDIMSSAVERSASISCKATTHIVLKDFVQDPNADRVRVASRSMAASLAVSLAAVTCRDALNSGLMTHLQHSLENVVAQHAINDIAALLCRVNHPVGCEYVERMALDRAMKDIEDHMAPSLEMRRLHQPGQQFHDPTATLHQPQIVPPSLQLAPSTPTPTQAAVYDSFQALSRRHALTLEARFNNWLDEMDSWTHLNTNPNVTYMQMKDHPTQKAVMDEITSIQEEVADPVKVEKMAATLFKHMWRDSSPSRYKITLVVVVVDQLLGRERLLTQQFVTQQWQRLPDSERWAPGFVEMLISLNLLHVGDVDSQLAYSIRTSGAGTADAPAPYLELFEQLLRKLVLGQHEQRADIGATLFIQDLQCAVTAMHGLAEQQGASCTPAVARLCSLIHQALAELEAQLAAGLSGVKAASDVRMSMCEDPALSPQPTSPNFQAVQGHRTRVVQFLDRWNSECEKSPAGASSESKVNAFNHVMALIVQDNAAIFLRVAFDVLIVHGMQLACLRNPPHNTAMDNFLCLLSTIVDTDSVEKATQFAKTCIITAFDATREACRRRKGALLPQPLHRMFIGIVNEILPSEKVPLFITLDQLAVGLRSLEPRLYPAFCFAWLEILAHRKVMVPMLSGPLKHQMQDTFVQLLCNAFHMLALMMREPPVQSTITAYYNGLARVLLVIMHDFPDVLCQNHLKLCGNMPAKCIQLRNIVLAAFPKTVILMDPMTAHSKLDKIPELAKDPLFTPPPWEQLLVDRSLLNEIENYLMNPGLEASRLFVVQLPKRLLSFASTANAAGGPGTCQNAVTVLVLFVGLRHINQGCRGQPIPKQSAAFQLFLYLAENLTPDILRMMVESIANQLRYPSSHTYYFSNLLLGLFVDVSKERPTREIITRVLLERCIALRPHPWGVMMTFCELLKNPAYNFWSQDFVNCTPEYSNLFDKLYHAESLHTTLSQSLALPGVTSVHA